MKTWEKALIEREERIEGRREANYEHTRVQLLSTFDAYCDNVVGRHVLKEDPEKVVECFLQWALDQLTKETSS